jgi:hypothetical protein
MLTLAPSDCQLALRSEGNNMMMCFEGPYTEVAVATIDLEVPDVQVPDDLRLFSMQLSPQEFAKVVGSCHKLSDQLILEGVETELKIMVDGQAGNGGVCLPVSKTIPRPFRMLYNMRMMFTISKTCGFCHELLLWAPDIGEDNQLIMLEYKLDDQLGSMKFYLASQEQ